MPSQLFKTHEQPHSDLGHMVVYIDKYKKNDGFQYKNWNFISTNPVKNYVFTPDGALVRASRNLSDQITEIHSLNKEEITLIKNLYDSTRAENEPIAYYCSKLNKVTVIAAVIALAALSTWALRKAVENT